MVIRSAAEAYSHSVLGTHTLLLIKLCEMRFGSVRFEFLPIVLFVVFAFLFNEWNQSQVVLYINPCLF